MAIGFALAAALAPAPAAAKTAKKVEAPYEALWNGAVRYLRVDRNFEIRDRDKDAGFIIFDWFDDRKPAKKHKAALEFIFRGDKEKSPNLYTLQLHIDDTPDTEEIILLDKLYAKIREEYGVK